MNIQINPNQVPADSVHVLPFLEASSIQFTNSQGESTSVNSSLFSGKKDTFYTLESAGHLFLLVGLGEKPDYKSVETSFRKILSKNGQIISDQLILELGQTLTKELLEAALVGFFLGNYHLDHYKKERKKTFENLNLSIISEEESIESMLERAQKIAAAKIEAFELVDLPPNKIIPEYLADWAKNLEKNSGVAVQVFDAKKAQELGLEAFLAVGRGSAKAPQFIVIEYRNAQGSKHLGLVGKGVTFDTGGLNIKTQGMHYMKSDMGGAATVLGATKLITDLQIPINLTTIVPAVENAVDKDAFLPSEIIGSHAGLSIEVVDTDAEGRLILADGLSYLIETYQPDQVIDFATLTGSAVGTFGYECAALFSNNEDFQKSIQDAGMAMGEKSWPLPLWESYGKEMDSEVADIRNYHGKPLAGAITAAKFLQAFTHEHPSWAHLDIAGVAYADTDFAKTKAGTAFGVGLLLKFIENQL